MSGESVQMLAPCDGCQGPGRWNGSKKEPGGTAWVVTCLDGTCTPAIAPPACNIEPVCVVETREPQYVPEYIRRFIGRRTA